MSAVEVVEAHRDKSVPLAPVQGPVVGRVMDLGAAAARNYAVTVMVAMPFAVLIFPPAIMNNNPDIGFIWMVFGMAMLATIVSETLVLAFKEALGSQQPRSLVDFRASAGLTAETKKRYVNVAIGAIIIGAAANHITAQMGIGTIEAQAGVSEASGGPVAAVLTMLRPYDLIGAALLIWGYRLGGSSGKKFLFWLLTATVLRFLYVLQLGITVQFWRYMSVVLLLLVFCKLIKLRWLLGLALVVAIAWPVLYEYRNESRAERGVDVVDEMDSSERLRYDLQVTRAVGIEPGQDIGQIPAWEVPRYGLIPGPLDPGRGSVDTAVLINHELLGGADTSAYTFLPVATAYILQGEMGMFVLYASYGLMGAWLIDARRVMSGAWVISFAMFMYGFLGWFFVFPDSGIATLQAIVTAIPVMWLIRQKTR